MGDAQLAPVIVQRLHALLESSDLDVTTEKHIRLRLESEFGVDLSEQKKALRQEIQHYLNSRQQEDEEPEPSPPVKTGKKENQSKPKEKKSRKRAAEKPADGEEKKKRGGGGLMKLCSLSPELASFLGVSQLPRTEVVQGIWKYIKEHDLQDPANKRVINCDAALGNLLGAPSTDMFQLNKLLKVHIHTIPTGDTGDTKAKPKEDVASQGTGSTRPLPLSPVLCNFLNTGESALPRSEVVKRVWAYVKERGLQDPSNTKVIICDAAMKDLLGVEVIEGFGSIAKLLSPHFGQQFESSHQNGAEVAGSNGSENFHQVEGLRENEHGYREGSQGREEGDEYYE